MGISSRMFRLFLLVSVLLNLGDAPYLDEILAEESQHQQQTALASIPGGGEPSAPQAPDPAKHTCCGYQLLLHLHGMLPQRVALPPPSALKEFLLQEFLFLAFAPPDRIDRPPCTALA